MTRMKRLILLRHAKAVAKSAADFDRALAERGRVQMTGVARTLADPDLRPDLAIVSPAARTRETWERTKLAAAVVTRFEQAIYDASEANLLKVVRGAGDEAVCVILVGHNPGLEELAGRLAAGPPEAAARLAGGLPTAALVVLDLPVASWTEVAAGRGHVNRVVLPDEG